MHFLRSLVFKIANSINTFFLDHKLIISYIGFGFSTGLFLIFISLDLLKKVMNKNQN